jgi:hypothetical protein
LASLFLLAAAAPAVAGMPIPTPVTCPIGGERFTHIDTASYSTFGTRPDGKPYGSWIFPMPLPVCPGNLLPIWREFSADELKRLEGLLASADWRAVADETPYWRAHWLARRLDPANAEWRFLLLQAGWEADEEPERRARYLRELIEVAQGLPDDEMGLSFGLRAANAWRELGRFDDAIRALDQMSPRIERLSGPEAEDQKAAMRQFATGLRAAALRRDSSIELLELTGRLAVSHRCTDRARGEALADPTGACDSPTVHKWVQEALARDRELKRD